MCTQINILPKELLDTTVHNCDLPNMEKLITASDGKCDTSASFLNTGFRSDGFEFDTLCQSFTAMVCAFVRATVVMSTYLALYTLHQLMTSPCMHKSISLGDRLEGGWYSGYVGPIKTDGHAMDSCVRSVGALPRELAERFRHQLRWRIGKISIGVHQREEMLVWRTLQNVPANSKFSWAL